MSGGRITTDDCAFMLESLRYTRMKFEDYPYPTEEIRRGRLADVDSVVEHVRWLRDILNRRERTRA